jgi:hypothetical protein
MAKQVRALHTVRMAECVGVVRAVQVARIACAALLTATLSVASVAYAQTAVSTSASTAPTAAPAPAPRGARSEVGHATVAWLDLQRSNAQAAPPQPMLGEEAGLAYRRYMESFKSRIPDLYGSALVQGSGGQGGGAAQSPQN